MKSNIIVLIGALLIISGLAGINTAIHNKYLAVDSSFEPHYTVFHGHTYITITPNVTIHDPDCEDRDLRDILSAHEAVKKVRK